MNDKDIDKLNNDIEEFKKRFQRNKDDNSRVPDPKVGNPRDLDVPTADMIERELSDSLERFLMPRDKLLKLEAAEEKGLYGIDQEKQAKIVQGMATKFMDLMIENNLTKVPNHIPIKLLFVTISFLLVDIVKHSKRNTLAQVDVMSAICSNISMLFKLTLDECQPQIQSIIKHLIPITLKTLITDGKLDEIGKAEDGQKRTDMIIGEVLKDVEEVTEAQNKEKEKEKEKKFWKDDIYKRD